MRCFAGTDFEDYRTTLLKPICFEGKPAFESHCGDAVGCLHFDSSEFYKCNSWLFAQVASILTQDAISHKTRFLAEDSSFDIKGAFSLFGH